MTASAKKQRATIRDVAAAAQVSIATVSLYMQGGKGVADETAERIAEAVKMLEYVPRSKGSNGRRATLIALLMEELSLTAFPETIYGAIIQALEIRARKYDIGMLLASVEEGRLPQSVRENQVEGVIILGGCPTNDGLASDLVAHGVPVVLVDAYIVGLPVTAIVPDNEWGGYCAYEHLVKLGHTRIAIIEGPPKYRTLVDRYWGALRAAEELSVPVRPEYRQPSISSGFPRKGYREMKQLLALPEPPTAVFAVSDRAALGALEAIKEAGMSVPDDMSLIGFDDDIHAEHATPPLTTVHFGREKMGSLALENLVETIDGKSDLATRICVPTELVVRSTTSAPRALRAGNGARQ
jgi:DNA-binding LacI/PurR family transcriptional regulator